jgi:PAS domain S-box-containing protein
MIETQPIRDDTQALRHCVRELAALSTLSAVWSRSDPKEIAEALGVVLSRSLTVTFVYVRLSGQDGIAVEVAWTRRGPLPASQTREVVKALEPLLAPGSLDQTPTIDNPFGIGTLRLAIIPIGYEGDCGVLIVGSRQTDFPAQTDRLLLGVAANQAATVLQHKRAEQQLRRREQELTDFFENATVGLHWVGPDGIILRANRAELNLLGYSADEYVGHHIAQFHADKELIEDVMRRLRAGEELREYEARLRCKDGSIKHVLIDSNVLWEDGRFIHTRCFTRDISDRKRAEEANAKLAAIVESSDDAIISKDLNSIITSWNYGAKRLFGYTEQEAIGQPVTMLIPADRVDEEPGILERIRCGERIEHYETVRRRKDGTLLDISLTVSPIRDAQGKIVGASKIARDITARKLAEEKLRVSEERFRLLNTDLENRVLARTAELQRTIGERERLQDQLLQAQKMESVGTLASGVAHDFNNLLNIILSHATIMRLDGKNPARISEMTAVIEETVRRGATLVEQLMMLGRKDGAEFGSVKLNEVAEKLAKLLTQTFPKTIVITLELERELSAIAGNENQLHQTLLNLCVNARDAMPKGGRIAIKTETVVGEELRRRMPEAGARCYASISVSDGGSGMDEATQRRIFEPFFTTKPMGEGTGLGLAVVYGIVKNHGGFIEVKSIVGHGATFCVYLPIPEKTAGEELISAANDAAPKVTGRGQTILFVDDEERQLNAMRGFLESEGYKVLPAKDGVEALERFKQHQDKIALAVLDLGLPRLGGWQAFQQMREIKPELQALVASGFVSPEVEAEVAQGKLAGVITKPYSLDDVLGKISTTIKP